MDNALQTVCDALKRVLQQLQPQHKPLSFTVLTGKSQQGKTTLLKQSHLLQYPLESDSGVTLFYNNEGVVLELGEKWLNDNQNLLTNALKQINRCNAHIKISGFILSVDSHELLQADASRLKDICQTHSRIMQRFTSALGYKIKTALFITRLDTLAGFCDFFQAEHASELTQPLGFSLEHCTSPKQFTAHFQEKYNQMIEALGQQVIKKLHPARSSVKRTHIREFPLQLNSLRVPIQTLVQAIHADNSEVTAVYFSSAQQGGVPLDKLNQKIQHEYALTLHHQPTHANNYRAYFVEGALLAFQTISKKQLRVMSARQKGFAGALSGLAAMGMVWLGVQYFTTSQLLDDASKELLSYEILVNQPQSSTTALYHLSRAENSIDKISSSPLTASAIKQLKNAIKTSAKTQLKQHFLPLLTGQLEHVMTDSQQTPKARYNALKIYLRLTDSQYFSEPEIMSWFKANWEQATGDTLKPHELLLLQKTLSHTEQGLKANTQLVTDVRNYLNALPGAYLYYSLAKAYFPNSEQTLNFAGFDLTTRTLPEYYTKAGFSKVMQQLPQISQELNAQNWVLERQDLSQLQEQLEQAYIYEYKTWWQNFIRRTHPHHYQNYAQARQLAETLDQHDTMVRLVDFIQTNTSPDISEKGARFNQNIASEFTNINLLSHSAVKDLAVNINELEKFLTTLQLVNDHGRTVFEITKERFAGESVSDPLSQLYQQARKMPEPVSTWTRQIADDTWFVFITESKQYLNQQWQRNVYETYAQAIANRYPLDPSQNTDIDLDSFNQFFAPNGRLNQFVEQNIKPFLDTSKPQWQPRELNGYVMPISTTTIDELIRANVISNMFFPEGSTHSRIDFSLQKISLDPIVGSLQLTIGKARLSDNQNTDSYAYFSWPASDARLALFSIEGNHYELDEKGTWAFFRILQKVNVLVDNEDSASLQILFEINGNSGRYLLKTHNPINPFSPGILTGFNLEQNIT